MTRLTVVVGGFYGDEGKGQVSVDLSSINDYDLLVRSGGSNAEHRTMDPNGNYRTMHVLPSALSTTRAPVILPSGMTFRWSEILDDLKVLGKPYPPIYVAENAAIITEELIEEGMEAAKDRGSTFRGVGATMARKVRRHGFRVAKNYAHVPPGVEVVSTEDIVNMYKKADNILLEGSQGTFLSLDHGFYPYETSRNCTIPAVISQCGLNWRWLEEAWVVFKRYPTRVPGPSGPAYGRELSWELVSDRRGAELRIDQTQYVPPGQDVGAGGRERVFEWSWSEVDVSLTLNGPTHIALTCLDWDHADNEGVTKIDGLVEPSRELVNELEARSNAPVGLIRTGQEFEHKIWMS